MLNLKRWGRKSGLMETIFGSVLIPMQMNHLKLKSARIMRAAETEIAANKLFTQLSLQLSR